MSQEEIDCKRPWDRDVGLTVFLVSLCLLAFVLVPITKPGTWRAHLVTLGWILVLGSGIFAASRGRAMRLTVAVLAALSLVSSWNWPREGGETILLLSLLSYIAFMSLTAVSLLRLVFQPGPVNSHRVRGAIAVYLLLGLIWAVGYGVVELLAPGQGLRSATTDSLRTGLPDQIYFSFVTLTTLGYGDVTPVGVAARTLAISEALVGQLYLATLVARLVSLRVSGGEAAEGRGAEPGG